MKRFVQPLLDGCDDAAERQKSINLGMLFWNLALAEDDERERLLESMLSKLPDDRDAVEFRALADDMVKRHRAMFPGMHQ